MEAQLLKNQLAILLCARSQLLPRRNLCPEEEARVVNNQLNQLLCAGSELLPRRILDLEEEKVRLLSG
jgi:hypothetical protein